MKKRLTRSYKGKEILCKACKTKTFKSMGDKEKYGVIVIHKKDCKFLKKLLKNSVEV